MEATITSKGQLTIPKPLRDRLRLHAGDRMEFVLGEDDHIEMIPRKSSIKELKKMAPPPVSHVTLDEMEQAIAEGAADYGRD